MKYEFELILKISGSSLQEIDDGLIQAAGDRLKARILGGLKMPTITPPSVTSAPSGCPSGDSAVVTSPVVIPPEADAAIKKVASLMTGKGDSNEKRNQEENQKVSKSQITESVLSVAPPPSKL